MKATVVSAAIVAVWAGVLAHDVSAATVEAGPILASRGAIAILGDSYSAGEGAEDYLPGMDTDANPCHRSPHTYLVEAFDIPGARNAACSGAVANDVHFSQQGRTVASQVEQLKHIREHGGVNAVVLTLGGNDAGFNDIAASCIIHNCSKQIFADPLHLSGKPSEVFVDERLDALPASLRAAYLALNYVVNGPEARATSDPVPILVLAYPLATPEQPRPCRQMYGRITGDEIGFLNQLGARLNDTIERTVLDVREEDEVPVFFVRNTETAFQNGHSLCDREPYARTVQSFDGAGQDPGLEDLGSKPSFWRQLSDDPIGAVARALAREGGILRLGVALRWFRLGIRELCHPTEDGYAALSRAALRWTRSDEAIDAARFLESSPPAELPPPAALGALGPNLGQLSPGTRPALRPGVAYPLTVGEFAPGSEIEIGVRSELRALGYATANADGEVNTTAAIPPDLEPGDHTVVIAGAGADNEVRRVEIPFRIDGGRPSVVLILLLGFGAGLLVAVVVAFARRQRN